MTQYLFNHRIEVHIDNGKESITFVCSNAVSSLEIHFDTAFSNEPAPNLTTISIFNLSESSRKKIKKGAKVTLKAGYVGDVGLLSSGSINAVLPVTYDGTTKEASFTFLEGVDYANKKEINMTFGKKSNAKSMIKKIAKKAKIPISKIQLKKNKIYKKGYTADGDPLSVLQEIVEACKSSMYFRRGKLIIRDIKKGDDERFVLQQSSGLISYPQRFEDDTVKGWSVQSLLQHRITTASIIQIKSKYVNGKFRVRSGTHSYDGSSFVTNCEVV